MRCVMFVFVFDVVCDVVVLWCVEILEILCVFVDGVDVMMCEIVSDDDVDVFECVLCDVYFVCVCDVSEV